VRAYVRIVTSNNDSVNKAFDLATNSRVDAKPDKSRFRFRAEFHLYDLCCVNQEPANYLYTFVVLSVSLRRIFLTVLSYALLVVPLSTVACKRSKSTRPANVPASRLLSGAHKTATKTITFRSAQNTRNSGA
jgi:hypothetical protein